MDNILQILGKSGNISIDELRSMVQSIAGNPKLVTEFVPEEGGGTFLHTLAKLPRERQAEVLPLYFLAVNKGVDVNAPDNKVIHPR